MKVTKNPIRLNASVKAVIARFLNLPGNNRISNLVKRVEYLEETDVNTCMEKVMKEFAGRHRNIEEIFLNHFSMVEDLYGSYLLHFSPHKKLLLGAFFTMEYAIQAAALFNPSIVPHPDQQSLKPGEQRFIMSLRATGEGHISSIVFNTGVVDDIANIVLDKSSGHFTRLQKKTDTVYTKSFINKYAAAMPAFNKSVLDTLPDPFTAAEANNIFKSIELLYKSIQQQDSSIMESILLVGKMLDTNYELEASHHIPINEKIIFPNARAESMGMEDVRFVKFYDEEQSCYYGIYTAYNGRHIKTQLIETTDFNVFKIRALYGAAVSDKGMALFPEKVNGKYAMIGRQGGEKITIMFSEDIYHWENFQVLTESRYTWELVQAGNCGSPVKTKKGWLLLIHGVGVMRTYVISAVLLDLTDPTRILGRLDKPLLEAEGSEREGYVPNVVYTCGCMLHGQLLIIPYAISDSATGFATIKLDEILNEMRL